MNASCCSSSCSPNTRGRRGLVRPSGRHGLESAASLSVLFCGVGTGNSGPRIYCLHFPTKFYASLEGNPSHWDNLRFAFLGEVLQGHITSVLLPNDAFATVTVPTKTQAYILQHLDVLTAASPLFPPVQLGDADVEKISTQRLMYLPAVYVPLLLSAGGYSIKQVREKLYPAVMQHQELGICEPLLKWLQVASTGTAIAGEPAMGDPAISSPLCAPAADEVLLTNRLHILHQVLPALHTPPESLEVAFSHMVTALILQTNETRLHREQKSAADLEPKLPSDKFSVTLPILLEYLQIADE